MDRFVWCLERAGLSRTQLADLSRAQLAGEAESSWAPRRQALEEVAGAVARGTVRWGGEEALVVSLHRARYKQEDVREQALALLGAAPPEVRLVAVLVKNGSLAAGLSVAGQDGRRAFLFTPFEVEVRADKLRGVALSEEGLELGCGGRVVPERTAREAREVLQEGCEVMPGEGIAFNPLAADDVAARWLHAAPGDLVELQSDSPIAGPRQTEVYEVTV